MTHSLDPAGLEHLQRKMAGYTKRGEIPGIVMLVSRGEEVHISALGTRTLGGKEPMTRDTIFRVASITKPITAAAAMILVDDGKLQLDDAIDPWIPELANRRVLKHIGAQLDETVPAKRAITLRDLQTSCMGFGSVMAAPGTYPIQKPIREGRLGGDGPPDPVNTPRPDEWIRRLGALPLMYQPGERWLYNMCSDVLGLLIARVSGTTFESFLRERLFEPLGMQDTAFSVPPEKLQRLCALYQVNHATQTLKLNDGIENSVFSRPPSFESGAGGLVSTVDDYHAFCRLMLNRGTYRGKRILSQASVEQMTRDQLSPQQRIGAEIFFGHHSSWGFGMSVNVRAEQLWQVPGRFGWDGSFGTSAYCDPQNDLIGILLSQRLMDSPQLPPMFVDFWTGTYRALNC